MYTLKIRWTRHEGVEHFKEPLRLADEATLFIPADQVSAHGVILGAEWRQAMSHWEEGDYQQYLSHVTFEKATADGETVLFSDGRLIRVTRNDKDVWYLASHAWLMGPDGKTIERLA